MTDIYKGDLGEGITQIIRIATTLRELIYRSDSHDIYDREIIMNFENLTIKCYEVHQTLNERLNNVQTKSCGSEGCND